MNAELIQEALEAILGIIETTYEHDKAGRRIEDMAGNASGADVIAMLGENEGLVTSALAEIRQLTQPETKNREPAP